MKKAILLLVLALLLTACGGHQQPTTQPTQPAQTDTPTVPPTAPQIDWVQSGPVKLVNVGAFDHVSNLMFAYGEFALLYHRDQPDAPYQILSPLGQAQLLGQYNAASYCGNGIALVSQPGESYDPMGLVDYRKGRVQAACTALRIMQVSQRYYLMVFVDDTVADPEGAFSFYTDKTGGVIYFAGHAKVLDAETGVFVPGLKLQEMPDDMGALGDRFYVRNGDSVTFYNADGSVAIAMEDAAVQGDVVLYPTFGGVNVYDRELQLVSQVKYASQRLTIVDGGYLSFYDAGGYKLLDLQGQQVLEGTFHDFGAVIGDRVVAQRDAGWGVITLSGEELLPFAYDHIQQYDDFRLLLEDKDGNQLLYHLQDGTLTPAAELYGKNLYVYRETEQGREYLLQSGETKVFFGDVKELGYGLLQTDDGLFELYTGSQLLAEYGYDRIAYVDGYVYARCHGIWTVFQVEITE